ncbi:MAG: hypothetical protein ACLGI3_05155 [Actinomycetes bacterium]
MEAGDPIDGRERLAMLIRQQAADAACWDRADTVVRASALRDRLAELGVTVTSEVAATLMAAAMVLASGKDEWGGDYLDALGDLAAVGLELFDS